MTLRAFQVIRLTMLCAAWQAEILQELLGTYWLRNKSLPPRPCNAANKFEPCLFKREFPKFICTAPCPWATGECQCPSRAIKRKWRLSVPVTRGTLALGSWQGIYLHEHARVDCAGHAQHRRSIVVTV